jgi:hypothetical protein
MDGTLETLDRKVLSGFKKLETKVDGLGDHVMCLQANNQERVDHLRMLAVRLRAGDGSSPPFSPPTRPQQQQVQQSSSHVGDNQPPPSPDDDARRHIMVPKHHLIQLLYDEWYGLRDSLDKPVVGRIAAIEARYKLKWRNHFSASKNIMRSSREALPIQKLMTRTTGRLPKVEEDPTYVHCTMR